jgi:hypothetical protein
VVAGLLTVIAPFLTILCFGVPSWFPADAALDTVTLVRPSAPWTDPAWSLAGRLLWSILLATGVVALFNLRGWCGTWLPLTLLLAGLAIPQACIWATGQSKYTLLGGLVPFSDAADYLDYSCQMLQNHRIVQGFTDRPMFSAMLSAIFEFTGLNLQPALATLLAFCGVGMFLATREMHARFGTVAGICFVFVIYVFYNRSIGTLMTEHLGLGLSLYSFPLLLRGVMERRRAAWFAGMFFLSAALWARAGAFFVLPAFCLVTGRLFRNSGRFSLRMFALAIAIMLVPFALNRALLVQLFDPATRPKSNFVYVAYGIIRGTNWTDAANTYGGDHDKIRAATLDLLRKKPHRILLAIRRAWSAFFWDLYGFIFMGPDWSRMLLYAFLFSLALGVARASGTPYDGFSVAIGGGILASVPFVPPADCDYMRAYAATIPLHACLAATGIGALARLIAPAFRKGRSAPVPLVATCTAKGSDSRTAVVFGSLMLVLTFAIPLARTLVSSEKPEYSVIGGIGRTVDEIQKYQASRPGLSGISGKLSTQFLQSLSIHLVSDDWGQTWLPNVRITDFRRGLGGFEGGLWKKEAAWLACLPPGVSLVNGGKQGILVLSTEKLLRAGSHVNFVYFNVGSLVLSCDTELSLPTFEDAAASPR